MNDNIIEMLIDSLTQTPLAVIVIFVVFKIFSAYDKLVSGLIKLLEEKKDKE